MKAASAQRANLLLNRSGLLFWQDESNYHQCEISTNNKNNGGRPERPPQAEGLPHRISGVVIRFRPEFPLLGKLSGIGLKACPSCLYNRRMDRLDASEVRVLGSLMEKEITTPDYYPMSLNALVNACNQKSNREPVVSYDEDIVERALERLRVKGLAVRITGGDSRVPKHGQRFTEKLNLGRREAALLCVLLLRGPQTVGELRGRSERLYTFDDLDGVETTLNYLAEQGLATKLARQAGSREPRFAHLLAGEVEWAEEPEAAEPPPYVSPQDERIAVLERDLAELRREFEDFRRRFE